MIKLHSIRQRIMASIRFGFGYFGAILGAVLLVLLLLMNIDKNIKQNQSDLEAKKRAQ